jgi:hypothetical protein
MNYTMERQGMEKKYLGIVIGIGMATQKRKCKAREGKPRKYMKILSKARHDKARQAKEIHDKDNKR